jgi:hypothetical protein
MRATHINRMIVIICAILLSAALLAAAVKAFLG